MEQHVESAKSKVTLKSAAVCLAGGSTEQLVGAGESSYERAGLADSAAIGGTRRATGIRSLDAPHGLES